MARLIVALVAGVIFGLGLTVSQMINPAKVIAFLDIFGDWDPSLAFVMGGAVAVTSIGYRLAWRAKKPLLAPRFEVPGNRTVDRRLALGAVLFGVGWGLAGLCPGPAISAVTVGGQTAWVFLASMAAGVAIFDLSPLKGR